MTIEILALNGFCTNSPARAVQEFTARSMDLFDTNILINQLDPSATRIDDLELARNTAGYMIQTIVRAGDQPVLDLYKTAHAAATKLKARSYQSSLYGGGPVTRMDEHGNVIVPTNPTSTRPNRRLGEKTTLQQAEELFNANPSLGRQAMMALFIDNIDGMKPGTASAYYAKLNHDHPRKIDPTTKAPRSKSGERREDQVKRVFESRASWTDRAELLDAIVAEVGCSRASANTFSYAVMPSTGRKGRTKKNSDDTPVTKPTAADILRDIGANQSTTN